MGHYKRKSSGSVEKTKKKQTALLKAEYDKCWYCGIELTKDNHPHRDHIVARSKGGHNDIDNKALTCPQCNRAKMDKDVLSYLQWLAHIRSGNFECYIIKKLGLDLGYGINDKLQKSFYDK